MYAGSYSTALGHLDGPLLSATFWTTLGNNLAFFQNGTLLISDKSKIRVVDPGGSNTRTIIDVTTDPTTEYRGICMNQMTGAVYAMNFGRRQVERIYLSGVTNAIFSQAWDFYPSGCAVHPTSGNIIMGSTGRNVNVLNPTTTVLTALLDGSQRSTINALGTASFSHEVYCVWVEPSSGDIIFCDFGNYLNQDGTGAGAVRRYNISSTATTTVFNVTQPISLTPDATGANWCVRQGRLVVRRCSSHVSHLCTGMCGTRTACNLARTTWRRRRFPRSRSLQVSATGNMRSRTPSPALGMRLTALASLQ